MNQKKYILFAILILLLTAGLFIIIQKISQTKSVKEPVNRIIDYTDNIDSPYNYREDGKMLFMSKCASCHIVTKDAVGPALSGVEERGPWKDSLKLYQYIRQPEVFKKNKYVDSLRKVYDSRHMGFPDLTNDEIKAILRYIVQWQRPVSDVVDY